MKASF